MVSGLAPGKPAETWMVGNSTWGRGATGRKRKASTPAIATAKVSSDVVTGRLMKVEEITDYSVTISGSMGLPTRSP